MEPLAVAIATHSTGEGVTATAVPGLYNLTDAVHAAIVEPWSQGPVGGDVHRPKR